jgi:hypothetical protein
MSYSECDFVIRYFIMMTIQASGSPAGGQPFEKVAQHALGEL